MILILKMEDGTTMEVNGSLPVRMLIRKIQNRAVETIVMGGTQDGKVLWEKQFNAVDVMPTDFGKPRD